MLMHILQLFFLSRYPQIIINTRQPFKVKKAFSIETETYLSLSKDEKSGKRRYKNSNEMKLYNKQAMALLLMMMLMMMIFFKLAPP